MSTAHALDNRYVAVAGTVPDAGAVVFWRLAGRTHLAALTDAWAARGLDPAWLPAAPTVATQHRRAVQATAEVRLLARPLGKGAWALVHEERVGFGDLVHTLLTRSEVADRTVGEPDLDIGIATVEPPALAEKAAKAAAALDAAWHAEAGSLAPEDVSAWIVALLGRLHAVALRDRGGIYFVPRPRLSEWRRAVEAIRACSAHVIHEIPALKSDEAVAAILAAVTDEADAMRADILAEIQAGDVGKRAAVTRGARVGAALAKVETYEALLGLRLGDLRERLDGLRAAISEAAMAAGGTAGAE